jgi:uncharacterized Ntn-hydrolase superfamily protein
VTYSIVAFDSANGHFGVAVASCVPLDVLRRVPGVVPGKGAFVTQSYLSDDAHALAERELEKGATADAALTALTDPTFDPSFQQRQYAIIDIGGRAAVFTGEDALAVAVHRSRRLEPFVYTLQGNILTGEATLDNMEAGFLADVCDLPERLMRSVETASFDGGGDSRCTIYGHPAQSVLVEIPSAGLAIEIDVGNDRVDPARRLRTQFDAWRKDHPCPTSGEITNIDDQGCHVAAHPPYEAPALFYLGAFVLVRRIVRWRPRPESNRRPPL